MDKPHADARGTSGKDKPTRGHRKPARGRSDRGARGGRGMSRGRGRGRGRRSRHPPTRVVAWHSDEEKQDGDDVDWTESDVERQDAEIDGVVDVAELEAFGGTMVVDADDVKLKQEKIAETKAQSQEKKKRKNKTLDVKQQEDVQEVKAAEVGKPKKAKEIKAAEEGKGNNEFKAAAKKLNEAITGADVQAKKPKKPKKKRVSIVITEDEVLEVVHVKDDMGITETGQTIAITVKEKKKQPKKKKNKSADETEVVYESVEMHEVLELVEDATPIETKASTKKKGKKANEDVQKSVQDPPVLSKKAQKKVKKKEAIESKETLEHADQQDTKAKVKKAKSDATEVSNKEKTSKTNKSAPLNTTSTNADVSRPKKSQIERKNAKSHENFYEDYSDRESVMQAIERGDLYQGKIRINPMYHMRAFITVDGIPVDILIDGTKDRNRAMDGDLVAIKVHEEVHWKPLKDTTKEDKQDGKLTIERNGAVPEATADRKKALNELWRPTLETARCFLPQQTNANESSTEKGSAIQTAMQIAQRSMDLKCRPTAKVVFIITAGNAQGFVGSLELKTKLTDPDAPLPTEDDYAYFNAQDLRLPRRIRIPRLQLPDEFVSHPVTYSQQMMCFCRITKWSATHESPMGEFVKTLGEYSGIESGISAILMKHGLMQHTLDFRHEILAELDEKYGIAGEKWTIPDEEVEVRRDFRSYQIFSIDPYNARDLDDALHIRALNKEATVFEVGVHIADVTHFIAKGSFLDIEAQQRATSVYLANRVLPMLPRILCERLCSLQPQVDRLALSVVWQMHSDGSLVKDCIPWFGKSMIRSCCKLDYGTAQQMLDGAVTADNLDEWEPERRPIEGDNPDITPTSVIQAVKYLWKVAKNRRATRFDTGAVTLQDIKLTFQLDAMGNPTSFGTYQIKDSNRLVEEYMLLANYLVAQKLLQAQGPLAFIRRHPEPNETALINTLSLLSENTIDIDGSSPKLLTDSLESVKETRGDYVYAVVQNMITKPMKPAEYLVAGTAGYEEAWRHYALNIPYYTHFTSPIRRYADVVVHRLLQESLIDAETVATRIETAGDDLTKLMTELQSVAQNCNEKKMTAKNAEKESDQVFLCAFVKHHGTVDVTGNIVSTGSRSFTVYISELGLEHRIEVKDLGSVRWSWHERTSTLSLEFNSTKSQRSKHKAKSSEEKSTANEEIPTDPSLAPERVELKFLTKLRMRMTTTDRMPLALKFQVIGPWKE